jgi:hypothetical protein
VITHEQAEQIAHDWARQLAPDATVRLEAFPLGYVVRRTLPEVARQPERLLDLPAVMILDGQTGEITPCPALRTSRLVELYTARHVARSRFPAELLGLLRLAGWKPGRNVGAVVDAWWSRCAAPGWPLPAAVRNVLAEFGGLSLRPARLHFAPHATDALVDVAPTSNGSAVCIGELGEQTIAVDERGETYLVRDGVVLSYGDTFDAALTRMVGLSG